LNEEKKPERRKRKTLCDLRERERERENLSEKRTKKNN
jgi:hypothetical protein